MNQSPSDTNAAEGASDSEYADLAAAAKDRMRTEARKRSHSQKSRSADPAAVSDEEYAALALAAKERMRDAARKRSPRRSRGTAGDTIQLEPQEYARLNRATVHRQEEKWEKTKRRQRLFRASLRPLGLILLAIFGGLLMLQIEKR